MSVKLIIILSTQVVAAARKLLFCVSDSQLALEALNSEVKFL